MDDNNRNLILATGLSFLVMLVWFAFFAPEPPAPLEGTEAAQGAVSTPAAEAAATSAAVDQAASDEAALAEAPRLPIQTERLSGSVSLLGGRIDDLALMDYRETLDAGSDVVTLLSPFGQEGAYYALYGWAPGAGLPADAVPGPNTLWSANEGATLGIGAPLVLTWDNGSGLTFTREIAIDQDYLFSVTQSVTNATGEAVTLAPYGILARHGEPQDLRNFFILHEGLVRMTDGTLEEVDYDKMPDFEFDERERSLASVTRVEEAGWIGFTDHFWMTTLIPPQTGPFKSVAKYDPQRDIYQAEAVLPTETVAAGAAVSVTTQLFAGAKEWETIRNYEAGERMEGFGGSLGYALFGTEAGVIGFLDSIDWGWFFFLTKPIFFLLHELNVLIGNMGWAIIALTLIIKAVLLPLAYKSYVSLAKMKELQPEMEKLKERHGEDREALQKGMMELYRKEKVNPASGCLPILLQIPIFFSLYKVIFVTLELRHAPWLGPFQDLSGPDPTSIINLFGLLPNAAPDPQSFMALIFLGIMPLILGISMWLQQKLNPAPTDPTQAMIFAWMPWVFMFMLSSFASGLILYWIANNLITFGQQYFIMRSQGMKPDIFGNIKEGFKRRKEAPAKAEDGKEK